MTTWTEELKKEVIDEYLSKKPTPANSAELVKEIAEERDMSPNGVRQVLSQAKVYVKKDQASETTPTKGKASGEGTKRVSKEDQIAGLKEAIEALGKTVDSDILDKMTGKAAAYFTSILQK